MMWLVTIRPAGELRLGNQRRLEYDKKITELSANVVIAKGSMEIEAEMKEARKRLYAALVDGATSGLSSHDLYDFVLKVCPDATSKRIVKASLLALSDPDLADRNILTVIYALAIDHRLDGPKYEKARKRTKSKSKVAKLPLPKK